MVVKGRRLTIKEQWQKLKDELKDMTPRERWEHLWEYYKWVLGVVFIMVIIIAAIIASIITLGTETIITGTIVNVPVNLEGYSRLQDGYYQHAKTEGRQAVGLTNFTFLDPYTTVEQTYTWDIIESITAMIGADKMDYMMYDDLAAEFFRSTDFFADLREVFTQEELDAMGNAVIKLKLDGMEEAVPIAIDIRDTVFYKEYVQSTKPIYLSFSVRLPREDACRDFWQYIKGGDTALLQTMIAGVAVDAPLKSGTDAELKEAFFASQGYKDGDQRVELVKESLAPALDEDGEDLAPVVRQAILEMLEDGSMDYVLCDADALAQFGTTAFLPLDQILSAEQLADMETSLITADGNAMAVDVSTLPWFADKTEGAVYLAFSANTENLQICKDLWNMISEK